MSLSLHPQEEGSSLPLQGTGLFPCCCWLRGRQGCFLCPRQAVQWDNVPRLRGCSLERAGQDGVFLCRNLLLPVPSSGSAPACFHWATQGISVLETCPGVVTMQGSHQERPWELARGRVPWEGNGEGSFSWPRSPCRGSARSWGSFLGSGASFFLLLHLWPPSGAPQAAAGAGLLCQSVLPWSVHACGTHGQECWLGLGLQDCESVVSWCLLLRITAISSQLSQQLSVNVQFSVVCLCLTR